MLAADAVLAAPVSTADCLAALENGGTTPYYAIEDGTNVIATLGLLPDTTYTHVVELKGPPWDAGED